MVRTTRLGHRALTNGDWLRVGIAAWLFLPAVTLLLWLLPMALSMAIDPHTRGTLSLEPAMILPVLLLLLAGIPIAAVSVIGGGLLLRVGFGGWVIAALIGMALDLSPEFPPTDRGVLRLR